MRKQGMREQAMPRRAGDDDRSAADAVADRDESISVLVPAQFASSASDRGHQDSQGAATEAGDPLGVPSMWPAAGCEKDPA